MLCMLLCVAPAAILKLPTVFAMAGCYAFVLSRFL